MTAQCCALVGGEEAEAPTYVAIPPLGRVACALGEGYDAAILIDAVPMGRAPGTVCIIEPAPESLAAHPADAHPLSPVAVLRLAREMGTLPESLLIVGCEPARLGSGACPDSMCMDLSPQVSAAVERAAVVVAELAEQLACGSSIAA